MNPYKNELLPTIAASITDVSHVVVLVLCAGFMLAPFAMLVGLVYSGIRNRRRTSDSESPPAEHSGSAAASRSQRPGAARRNAVNGTLVIGELLWIASTLGALAAQRRDSLAWRLAGVVFGPLIAIALALPRPATARQSLPRGGRP